MLRARSNPPFIRLRVRGLLEDGLYRINNGEEIYEGSALMYGGICFPSVQGDYQGMRFWIKQIKADKHNG